jgi:hypothetical protein
VSRPAVRRPGLMRDGISEPGHESPYTRSNMMKKVKID